MRMPLFVVALCVSVLCNAAVDPTRPEGYEPKTVSRPQAKLELQSIMIRGQERSAVIDGKLYREGERVSGVKIVKIENWRVVLMGSTGRRVLEIASQPVIDKGYSK
ncbi:hypothetical protein [Aestuariirhabdus sp. LZHN29]|uniref:hypothetical protein n=1 Tax=Aestuariirhabdus sp. LZHN29 TaxID=3417462 RepID=UPI003CEACD5F